MRNSWCGSPIWSGICFHCGANKGNVSNLSDYINNEVYRLMLPGEIPMTNQDEDHSTIRIVRAEIGIS